MIVGIVASATANFSFCPPKKPLRPSDFGLGPRLRGRTAGLVSGSTPEAMRAERNVWRALTGKQALKVAEPPAS
jgi:hypothetical protein